MKDNTYMYLRLIMPLIGLIIFYVSKDVVFAGFAAGYMLCWVFSFLHLKLKEKKE